MKQYITIHKDLQSISFIKTVVLVFKIGTINKKHHQLFSLGKVEVKKSILKPCPSTGQLWNVPFFLRFLISTQQNSFNIVWYGNI